MLGAQKKPLPHGEGESYEVGSVAGAPLKPIITCTRSVPSAESSPVCYHFRRIGPLADRVLRFASGAINPSADVAQSAATEA